MARGENGEANSLAKMVVAGELHLTQHLPFKVLQTLTIEAEKALSIDVGITWMTLVFKFLTEDELSQDELEAK